MKDPTGVFFEAGCQALFVEFPDHNPRPQEILRSTDTLHLCVKSDSIKSDIESRVVSCLTDAVQAAYQTNYTDTECDIDPSIDASWFLYSVVEELESGG